MNRFYAYKCIHDEGGAPCVERGLLSLCLCKPAIRSTARVGDLIFAFGSNSESPANRLVYIAEVTHRFTDGEYYELAEFRDRGDCIYERTASGRFRVRPGARFHGSMSALVHDLGQPPDYQRANSLVSRDFRYFGAQGTADWKARAPRLTRLVESMRRGHRVIRNREMRDELLALKRRAWLAHRKKLLGKPLHVPNKKLVQIELPSGSNAQRV